MVNLEALLGQAALYGALVALAALGEMLLERAGRLNLGLEGMLYLAYGVAGALAPSTGSLALSWLGGLLAAMAVAAVYYVLVEVLGVDQVVVGLSLVFMGYGLGDAIGTLAGGAYGPVLPRHGMLLVEAAALMAAPAALYWLLYRSWLGYVLRAPGEDERAARFYGVHVGRVRLAALAAEAVFVSIAAVYLLSIYGGGWKSGYAATWGWLALAIVILGYWHPVGVAAASIMLGLLYSLRPLLPAHGVPPEVADTLPYLAVVVALAAAGKLYRRLGVAPPAIIWRE